MTDFYEFSAKPLTGGDEQSMSEYRGQVALVVNVASKCGFTPQYAGLEKLYTDYRDKGLVVLGFPCNQFGEQEPGSVSEIASFCSTNYGVDFPMFDKVEVNGREAHPLFKWLKKTAPGLLGVGTVKWNFTKFLIGRDGTTVRRYGPDVEPAKIAGDIEAML